MIEEYDLEELDDSLRRTRVVDAKLLHLPTRALSQPPDIDPTGGSDHDKPVKLDAVADVVEQKPAPHASAAAYRMLAATMSPGAVKERLLKKAAEFEDEARASVKI
jgi:hypothetical protein